MSPIAVALQKVISGSSPNDRSWVAKVLVESLKVNGPRIDLLKADVEMMCRAYPPGSDETVSEGKMAVLLGFDDEVKIGLILVAIQTSQTPH